MNTESASFEKPPFYASLHLEPSKNLDRGQYSDAISTMISIAKLNPGFIGFSNNQGASSDSIIVIYFSTYEALKEWLNEARDLIPYTLKINDIIEGTGCLWKWLESSRPSRQHTNILKVA